MKVTSSTTYTASSTTTNYSFYPIRALFSNLDKSWSTINTDSSKYLNPDGIIITKSNVGGDGDGGSYSDSHIYSEHPSYKGKGMYVGARYSGTSLSMISTTYDTSYSCSGEYIDVFLDSGKFILLNSFSMSGFSSWNWDDYPYKMIILGTNNDSSWNLIKNVNDLNVNTNFSIGGTSYSNSDVIRNIIPYLGGYVDSSGKSISQLSSNYTVNANVSYTRIRFVITELIRGRILNLRSFNMFFNVN